MSGNQKFISYLRASTERQGRSGLGIEAQRRAVSNYIYSADGENITEYLEVESGKRDDRPQLKAAVEACKRHRATLIVAKADRLGRRASFVLSLLDNAGISFVFAEMPNASQLEIGIRAVVAQEEGRLISERTKAALTAAKDRGVVLGGRRTEDQYERAVKAIKQKADTFADSLAPIINEIRQTGPTSLREIATALNARGVRTPRGHDWHPASVLRLLRRIEA